MGVVAGGVMFPSALQSRVKIVRLGGRKDMPVAEAERANATSARFCEGGRQ